MNRLQAALAAHEEAMHQMADPRNLPRLEEVQAQVTAAADEVRAALEEQGWPKLPYAPRPHRRVVEDNLLEEALRLRLKHARAWKQALGEAAASGEFTFEERRYELAPAIDRVDAEIGILTWALGESYNWGGYPEDVEFTVGAGDDETPDEAKHQLLEDLYRRALGGGA